MMINISSVSTIAMRHAIVNRTKSELVLRVCITVQYLCTFSEARAISIVSLDLAIPQRQNDFLPPLFACCGYLQH